MKLTNNALAWWESLDEGLLGPTSLAIRPILVHELDMAHCRVIIVGLGVGVPIMHWLDCALLLGRHRRRRPS